MGNQLLVLSVVLSVALSMALSMAAEHIDTSHPLGVPAASCDNYNSTHCIYLRETGVICISNANSSHGSSGAMSSSGSAVGLSP